MSQETTYINIQSWMVQNLKLKSNELIIYALIHGFCQDGHSYFYGSIKYIMEQTNLSKEGVLSVLQSLVQKGLIIKTPVQNLKTTNTEKFAHGSIHYNLYHTVASRLDISQPFLNLDFTSQKNTPANKKNSEDGSEKYTGSKKELISQQDLFMLKKPENSIENIENDDFFLNFTEKDEENISFTGQKNTPVNSKNQENGSEIYTGTGQNFPPVNSKNTGQNFPPNTISSLKDTATDIIKKQTADFYISQIQQEFAKKIDISIFSDDFWQKMQVSCKQIKAEQLSDFINFIFMYTQEKNPKSIINYIYKTAWKPYMIPTFFQHIENKNAQEKSKAVEKVLCPICGTENKKDSQCKTCSYEYMELQEKTPEEILKLKKIYNLPENIKLEYEKEISQLVLSLSFLDSQEEKDNKKAKLKEIDKKYGLITF